MPTQNPSTIIGDSNVGVIDTDAKTPELWRYVLGKVGANVSLTLVTVDVNGASTKHSLTITTATGITVKNALDTQSQWLDNYVGAYITSISGGNLYVNTAGEYDNTITENTGSGDTVLAAADYSQNPIKISRIA